MTGCASGSSSRRLFLSPLVAALQADGISAVIEAPSYANYPPEHVVGGYPWMKGVRVLETACTLVGEADPPRECVVASAAVYRDVGRFVVDWCADLAQGAGLVVGLATTWFEATPAEALECWDIAVDATATPMRVAAETATGVFRVGQVDRYRGRAMFVQGPHVGPDAIVANVNEARRILLSAPWAIYAYVKVSSDQTRALGDASLRDAWVPMPHVDNYALPFPALDATHVPDVFGLQLLGADHDLHSLDPAEWTVTQTESGQDIVEHHDTEAWFLEEGPRVALVERARRDFTPLLRTTADLVRYRRRRTP